MTFPMIPLLVAVHSQTLVDDAYFEMLRTRGAQLATKLADGRPVRMVAFGDSVTAGWGVDEPAEHTYHELFATTLRWRYPDSQIEMITEGGPGDSTAVALERLNREVIRRSPDLVIVQFGGNDEGQKRKVADYERDLRAIVEAVVLERIPALCIVCTPPMNDPQPDSPYVEAARRVAGALGCVVADLDAALRNADRDYRGPFCWGSHPGAFTHAIMAKGLLRACDRLLDPQVDNRGARLSVEVAATERPVSLGDALTVPVAVQNASADRGSAELLAYTAPGLGAHRRAELDAGQRAAVELDLGQVLPVPRRRRIIKPVMGLGRLGDQAAFDLKWATLTPAITADAEGSAQPTWHTMGAEAIVLGAASWEGPQDLGARFSVTTTDTDRLRLNVEVRDDDLRVRPLRSDPSMGDSVELYFDCRPPQSQGKPTYTPEVAEVICVAPTRDQQPIAWRPLDDLVAPLNDLRVGGGRTAGGYRLSVELSLAAVRRTRGEEWSGMGFDVGINDADRVDWRQTQMIFSGSDLDYVDAGGFAGLYAPSTTPPDYRLTVR